MSYPTIKHTRNVINSIFENKNVFYFPIVSMQNRETFQYKLDQDGNVNRFITFFSKCNTMNHLYICLPSNYENISYYKKFANIKTTTTIFSGNFGKHALDQRTNYDLMEKQYEINENFLKKSDIIIVESQALANILFSKNLGKQIIYWCPVSVTNKKSRSFIEAYRDIDKPIFEKADYVMVASPEQYDYLIELGVKKKKILYYYELMDRNLPIFSEYDKQEIIDNDKKVIYLPFRLTDEGYKTEYILDNIELLNVNYPGKFKVAYSDPNNSKFEKVLRHPELYHKVSSDRNTYYSYLDSANVIIPYFEDINYVNHAAIHEFNSKQTKCTVLLNNSEYHAYNLKHKNIQYIDLWNLYKKLEDMINE